MVAGGSATPDAVSWDNQITNASQRDTDALQLTIYRHSSSLSIPIYEYSLSFTFSLAPDSGASSRVTATGRIPQPLAAARRLGTTA